MTGIRRLTMAGVAAALTAWVVAGSTLAADTTVTIEDLAFSPPTVTVESGDSVTWVNDDTVAHTATDVDGGFDTQRLDPGDSATVVFDTAGTSSYVCSIHAQMTGTVVVQATGAVGGDPARTPAPTDTLDAAQTDAGQWPLAALILGSVVVVVLLPARFFRRRRG